MTKATLQSVIEKAGNRHDEWGDAVKLRVSNEFDFIAAEVKYHHDCQVLFYAGKLPSLCYVLLIYTWSVLILI
jgi:hypothetical protein